MRTSPVVPVRLQLGANNVYALSGPDGVVCVDAGPDYQGAWEELTAQLAAQGATVRDVRAVILTHSHLDHAGLAARWQQQGARIYAGRGDEQALALDEEGQRELRALAADALIEHGVPEELTRRPATRRTLGRSADAEDDWPAPLRMTPLTPDRLLDDGDELVEAGIRLRAIACPGHTPGTLVLCDDSGGRVHTGDHVLPRMVATVGIQFDGQERWPSLPPFVRSLGRFREWTGAAWPGHGDFIADVGAAADWSLRHLERRAERLRRRLADGPGTAYDLAMRLLPHLKPEHVWPVMAETIGLLDLLTEQGDITAERDAGRIVFRLKSH